MIDGILASEQPNAVMWVAYVCRDLQYRLPFVTGKVSAYSADLSLGILALNAKMILKQMT